jgi:DNA-binding beta-propeller fold protein YncE
MLLLSLLLAAAAAPASHPFPGSGEAFTDYLAVDPTSDRVWVPAGNRGAVYVFDAKAKSYATVSGFPTAAMGKRVLGPTSVTIGPAAYVGNRGDSRVCAVDRTSLKLGACVTLPSMPDGLAFVPTTSEIWVTTPRTKNLTVVKVDAAGLSVSGTVEVEGGAPEGYAVDAERGLFFTNDEDGDRVFTYDVRTRKRLATFPTHCGKEGPRGLALDLSRRMLVVGCAAGASILDLAKGGGLLGHLDTAGGVDTIDYDPATHRVFIASGRAGTLIVADVDAKGGLHKRSETPTAQGIRAVVLDGQGNAFLPDSRGARLLVVPGVEGPAAAAPPSPRP